MKVIIIYNLELMYRLGVKTGILKR